MNELAQQVAVMPDLTSFYWIVGAMIVTNIGTIGTIFFWAAKALWWVSKLDSQVQLNKKDINAAHKAIKEISV